MKTIMKVHVPMYCDFVTMTNDAMHPSLIDLIQDLSSIQGVDLGETMHDLMLQYDIHKRIISQHKIVTGG